MYKQVDIFRKVVGWSVGPVLLMAGLVLLQSGPLSRNRKGSERGPQ